MRLSDAITETVAASGQVSMATGEVVGVAAPKVVVSVGGGDLLLPRLGHYTPTVGDVVLILLSPAGWLVIGKVATT